MGILFPKRCVLCRKTLARTSAESVCAACMHMIEENQMRIYQPILIGEGVRAWAVFRYEGAIADAMRRFKFHHASYCATWFARQLDTHLAAVLSGRPIDLVTYVPIGPQRFRERGYNQSAMLARYIAKRLGVPCRAVVRKRLFVRRQSELGSSGERWHNAARAFAPRKTIQSLPDSVLLIDDIITTGATLYTVTQMLHALGARQVYAAAVCAAIKRESTERM